MSSPVMLSARCLSHRDLPFRLLTSAPDHTDHLAADITEQDLKTYVHRANNALSSFDLEIRSSLHQSTRKRIYALVNSTSDTMSQLATSFSADEISFLKRVLDAMFITNNRPRKEVMAIKGMQAIQLHKAPGGGRRRTTAADMGNETMDGETGRETQGSSGTSLTMAQAEKVLAGLVGQGWFEKSRKGYYSLSPRALMELRGWLTETYNEDEEEASDGEGQEPLKIKFCFACKEIVTVGQRCRDWRCQCRIHDICVNSFFQTRRQGQGERTCPICRKEWDGESFVGERADRRD